MIDATMGNMGLGYSYGTEMKCWEPGGGHNVSRIGCRTFDGVGVLAFMNSVREAG
jgi:hypothetical protein